MMPSCAPHDEAGALRQGSVIDARMRGPVDTAEGRLLPAAESSGLQTARGRPVARNRWPRCLANGKGQRGHCDWRNQRRIRTPKHQNNSAPGRKQTDQRWIRKPKQSSADMIGRPDHAMRQWPRSTWPPYTGHACTIAHARVDLISSPFRARASPISSNPRCVIPNPIGPAATPVPTRPDPRHVRPLLALPPARSSTC